MNLDEFIAVSGLPGVYKVGASRSNGLLLEDIDTGKTRFASVRKHQFTPLASVAIYTLMDSTPLSDIFETMKAQMAENPPVSTSADAAEIFAYFEKILPDFDRDKVYISDIKKVIKWFVFLEERSLLVTPSDEEE
jgi:hypothetical protein